ncbi:MAG: HipA family kinase [Verrucomicrobiota bacterium]
MLPRFTVSRFGKVISSGRTRPCIVYCENEEGEEMEFVIKLTGSEGGVKGLVCEIIAAQFANDLDLRIPESSLLEIGADFAATVPNKDIAEIMNRSIGWNFATKKLPASYYIVPPAKPLSVELRKTAAEIFAFDAMIQNPDRRIINPNCLTNGNEIVILDHELAFSFLAGVLFWSPPWENGDLNFLKEHIFHEPLRKTPVNFDRLAGAVEAITDEQIQTYAAAVPPEWDGGKDAVTQILEYILSLKQNILPTLEAIRSLLQ